MTDAIDGTTWSATPTQCLCQHTPDSVRALWPRLHAGDAEPLPASSALLQAWVHYHNGAFEESARAARALGTDAQTLVLKAQAIHATYVEPREPVRLARLWSTAQQALALKALAPLVPGFSYWHGYALGRYSQGVSVAKALALGFGAAVRLSLQTAIDLAPAHADAHLAMARFHAEVIDKVGPLIGSMVHGARRETGMGHFETAMALNPDSPITHHEHATGLLMLGMPDASARAQNLREQAALLAPQDAMEHLYLAQVKADLNL
jgi:hypothetical protein